MKTEYDIYGETHDMNIKARKSAYRLYSDYLNCNNNSEITEASARRRKAEKVLRRAVEISADHLLRLAPHFAEDYGRLPDDLHNMVILTGGDLAARYLEWLEKRSKET